jgi:hypothetical protein
MITQPVPDESEAAHRLVITLMMLHDVLAEIEDVCPDSNLTARAWCLTRLAQRDSAQVFDEMKTMRVRAIVATNKAARRK